MYETKAQTTKITATSRMSMKYDDSFYTFEYSEERFIPDIEGVDLEFERENLWTECHFQVDKQVQDTIDALEDAKKSRKNRKI